jgi:exonuclease SbcD
MKLIHLSDLHLGKRVNEFSMLEDQADILSSILRIIDEVGPEAVIVAGDVYDKPVPPAEAVELFDDFLWQLARRKVQAFVISGNHDSPERIAFASRLIDSSGIHLSPVYNGKVAPVSLQDQYGPVNFYMLPFIKPAHVRRFFEDAEINSYTDALRVAIDAMEMNHGQRNVLITHQFVTGASRSESEDISVGGADNVDAAVFDGIDYVALGHIHGPQNIGSDRIRYCGTPLKYSFSEVNHTKSVTVVTLAEKGKLTTESIPLTPKHDMRELRGFYMDLTARQAYERTATDDYLHITLTDEEDIPDVMNKLRVIYPNLMKLEYDNKRTRSGREITGADAPESKSPLELVAEFYELQNGQPMSEEQARYSKEIIEKIWED